MTLPLTTDYAPMEARVADEIPSGKNWLYEPKWDGFRCIAFRDGETVHLRSKSGQTLERYFPELVDALLSLRADHFILDGEIVVPVDKGNLSFNALLQRIHPAASRIRRLADETPALLIIFDMLADSNGKSLVDEPLVRRRKVLESFMKKYVVPGHTLRLSPATSDFPTAEKWFGAAGAATDGIMAKELNQPYHSGTREGMVKIKPNRTAECVIGGFRYASKGGVIGSLLLGLYNDVGLLDHVGFCSGFKADFRKEITPRLKALIQAPGFTGNTPGGPSRWSTERSTQWEPLKPVLVAEFEWDHFTNGRFRHGTKFLRWRPDKPPGTCTMDQVNLASSDALKLLD